MAPIIKILRGHTAPPTLEAGRIAIDQTNKNLYVGIDDGAGGTINEIVGGSGTFATKQFVTDAVSAGTGSLGTMSTQNADSVAITGGAIDGTAIGATTPSTGKFTDLEVTGSSTFTGPAQFAWGIKGQDGGSLYIHNPIDISLAVGGITGLADPVNDNDAARKKYVDDAVAAAVSTLGSVFRFVGDVSQATGFEGIIRENLFDLDTLPDTAAGAYYRVDVAGVYTAMLAKTQSFDAKVGDAFVQTTDGWQKLDNVDAEVFGTANEIVVTGDENAGYAVALAEEFKTRVSDVESKMQNIDLAGTTAGTTKINGNIVGSGTNSITDFIIDGGEY